MDHLEREAGRLTFTHPVRQLTFMIIALGLVIAGFVFIFPRIQAVFLANPYLNGFIGLVFVIGVIACFAQIGQLVRSVGWLDRFLKPEEERDVSHPPQLLASMAALMGDQTIYLQISTSSTRSILDSVATRIDEARDITRYIANLLIFLGLLGTFYGLATTVPAVVDTIRSLAPSGDEGASEIFTRLMSGLEAQLGGMGTAFASSLLGLAGSLVVSLLELFASHGQNRFYRELEEWLSSFTSLSLGSSSGDEDGSGAAAAFEHLNAQFRELQAIVGRSEQNRARLDASLMELTQSLGGLEHTASALQQVAAGQERLIAALESGESGIDAETRLNLRSINVQAQRILEEITVQRHESFSELRSEVAKLTKALNALDVRGR